MILQGDCLARLAEIPDESVHCVVTSPPYFGLASATMNDCLGRVLDLAEAMRDGGA
jgi:DNA modification methylase